MNEKTSITINSAVLYVVAFLATTIIHEFAHAIFGMIFGSSPVLHHNYVEHLSPEKLSVSQISMIALAGPLVSLLQGILAGFAFIKFNRFTLFTLFLLWFSILGFNNFLGYVMTGPLFKQGDIGKVYLLLEVPIVVQIICAIVASLTLLYIAYKLTAPFLRFTYNPDWVANEKLKKNFSFRILILPWIIGSAIITAAYLPVIATISIIYPIMSGMVFIFPWQNAGSIEPVEINPNQNIGKISFAGIAVLLVLILVFRLVLAPGIAL